MIVIRAAGAKVATKLAKKEIHANCVLDQQQKWSALR